MNEQLTNRLRNCKSLPTLPSIALKVIELANDPDVNLEDICQYIMLDPALSAKILKMANSPLYQSRRSPSNIRQAISMLGTHTVIVIALSFSLVSTFTKSSAIGNNAFDNTQFWRRATASALACRALGEKLKLNARDDLFLAGLLQDIGILAYFAIAPEEYESIYAESTDHDTLIQNERHRLGSGHDEVGYTLLKQWHIPDHIALSCLASHCQPGPRSASVPNLYSCTAVSRYLAEFFLSPRKPENMTCLLHHAQGWLNIDAQVLLEVVDTMTEGITSVEELFELKLYEPDQITHILNEAKELLVLQSITRVKALETQSRHDGLTGIMNRQSFDETIQREFNLSINHHLPLTIVMIDIDHFKTINDDYGHVTGDEILSSFSQIISQRIREDDYFCRYGGEEFALILPGTPLVAARNVISRLQDAITANPLTTEDGTAIKLTASFGVASCTNGKPHFKKTVEFIKAADSALLAAKKAGRNRVVEWNEP